MQEEMGKIITVKNTEDFHDTQAEIIVQNNIDYIPKVSVIIPVYNTEGYLRECLDSVVNQTLKDIEIICVDDGSDDNSLDILKEYAKNDNRITVLRQENLRAGVARNAGLAIARGDYLGFLDSDDIFELNMFERLVNSAQKNNSEIVVCQYVNYSNYSLKQTKKRGIDFKIQEEITYNTDDIKDKLFTICNPMPWNKIFKKELLVNNDIYFQNLIASNDVYMTTFALACANRISFIPDILIKYRYNRAESLKNTRDKNPYSFFKAFTYLHKSLQTKGLFEKYKKTFFEFLCRSILWTLNHTYNSYSDLKNFVTKTIIPTFELNKKNKKYLKIKLKNTIERNSIIVSLTSYPARIETVNQTIESLLNQSIKADKVILWLAPEQFPNKEKDLPTQLLDLQSEGLVIDWYHDIKSYKKLIPTLKKIPDNIIVTADDDLIYEKDWLEKLYNGYLKNPKQIHCHRAHRILFDKKKQITPYKEWVRKIKNIPTTSYNNFCTTGGGALYPPKCLHKDVLNEKLFTKLCPQADDIWFWAMAVLNNTKINIVKDCQEKLHYIKGTQEGECLWKTNLSENKNDEQLKNVLNYYPEILNRLNKRKFNPNKHSLMQKIFSITNQPGKNDKWYKVIHILGIKFSFKNKKKERNISEAKMKKIFEKMEKEIKLQKENHQKLKHELELRENNITHVINNLLNKVNYTISIVIPIYNALEDVKLCLNSIINNVNLNTNELILVNDCSNNETTDFLNNISTQNSNIKLLNNEENSGFIKTCNKGIKEANGDIVVLLNSDTMIPQNFCEKISKCFASNFNIGIASPIGSFTHQYFIPLPENKTIEDMNKLIEKHHVCSYPKIPNAEGFCFCIRKEVIEQQGYLDEIYGKGYHEEIDFSFRCISNGWEIVLIDNLYVYHKRNASFGDKTRKELIKQNNPIFYERWEGFKSRFIKENNLTNPVIQIKEELEPHYTDCSERENEAK